MTFSTFSPLTTERLLVPRWRSLAATLRSRELAHPPKAGGGTSPAYSRELVQRLERWRLSPGLVTAAELVEAALVDGRETEAVPAARTLISDDLTAEPLIRAQAAALLVRAGLGSEVHSDLEQAPSNTAGYWRGLTRLNPHEPIAWVELALHQTVAAHTEAEEMSMRVARQLAPDNRHVLRSAARLYLHVGRPEKAHDLLLRSAATRSDPWLIRRARRVRPPGPGRFSESERHSERFPLGHAPRRLRGVRARRLVQQSRDPGTACRQG